MNIQFLNILMISLFLISELTFSVNANGISLCVEKNNAQVGDIILASVIIDEIPEFMGYQVNIKFDPTVFQAVDPNSGEAYIRTTAPGGNTILNDLQYLPMAMVGHDLASGVLNFGRLYFDYSEYKASGKIETKGVLGVIGFKALKSITSTSIDFADTVTMPNSVSGTNLYTLDSIGKPLTGYSVISSGAITIGPAPMVKINAKKMLKSTSLKVDIFLKSDYSEIGFLSPENGTLSLKLYNLNGKLLYAAKQNVLSGSVKSRFNSGKLNVNNIVCAEIVFRSTSGNEYIKLHTLRSFE